MNKLTLSCHEFFASSVMLHSSKWLVKKPQKGVFKHFGDVRTTHSQWSQQKKTKTPSKIAILAYFEAQNSGANYLKKTETRKSDSCANLTAMPPSKFDYPKFSDSIVLMEKHCNRYYRLLSSNLGLGIVGQSWKILQFWQISAKIGWNCKIFQNWPKIPRPKLLLKSL